MPYPNINAERSRRGMTIEEMARSLGVTRKTVYNWMTHGHIPAMLRRQRVILLKARRHMYREPKSLVQLIPTPMEKRAIGRALR